MRAPVRAVPRCKRDVTLQVVRRQLDSLLVQLATAFVQSHADGAAPRLIDEWLGKLSPFVRADRITLWELSTDAKTVVRRHVRCKVGFDPAPGVFLAQDFAWLTEQNRQGRVVAWERVPEDIPSEAVQEREYGLREGVKSLLSIPVSTSSRVCVLVLTYMNGYSRWRPMLIERLRLVTTIFAEALARQRAEGSLRTSEARNRAILTVLPDVLFVLSADGVFVDFHCGDKGLLELPEPFPGRTIEEAFPAEVAGSFRHSLSQTLRGGCPAFEFRLSARGEEREYEARMVRREDGAVVCIVRDISESNQTLRQLRESEERFRGAFEHSAIGMAIVARDGRWLQTNAATSAILGYSPDELRSRDFQAVTHPDDLATDLEQYQRVLDGELDHYQLEKRYINKSGRIVPAFLSVSIVRDEAKRPLYFVSQLIDLTERKSAAMENERLRMELAHSGRLVLGGQLTASLAHQMLQPVAAIQWNALACQRLLPATLSSTELGQGLSDILSNCTRASDIINHFRDFLRKEPARRQRVSLNALAEQVIGVMAQDLVLRNVRLISRLDSSLPEMLGSPIELQQVVLNLIVNSAEALQHAPSRREIVVESARGGRLVRLSVIDSGPGIPADAHELIFQPFFTTKPDGMGMGLTICAEIVRAHGGEIRAVLNEHGGLTMHCTFPVAERPTPCGP